MTFTKTNTAKSCIKEKQFNSKRKNFLSMLQFVDQFFVFLNNIQFFSSWKITYIQWTGGDYDRVVNITNTAWVSTLL